VPKAAVPDNLKAGITKPSRYEPGVNRTYQDLADHYGFVVLPARVRRPRDKAKVEAAVGIVSRFVLGKLRNRRFFSLAELNDAVRDCVTKINAKVMKHLKQSRNDLFASLDRPALKRLPGERYQYAEWKRCTVAPDYHVEAIMKAKPHPEQGFRSCLGILSLVKSCGPERIEAAARRGNDIGATTYGSIKSILQNGLDRAFAKPNTPDASPIRHANIRGRGYYH
jgi:transposase